MATQQPVARDLRLIVSFQHMVLELERMGDHAVGIARAALRLNDLPQLKPYVDLPKMAELTELQVHEILGAVIEADEDRAGAIAERDDEVDVLYHKIWEELIRYMVDDPTNVQRAAILSSSPRTWSESRIGSPTSPRTWSACTLGGSWSSARCPSASSWWRMTRSSGTR